jgi:hypothetical protein
MLWFFCIGRVDAAFHWTITMDEVLFACVVAAAQQLSMLSLFSFIDPPTMYGKRIAKKCTKETPP